MCSVPWGVQYCGGYNDACGGYLEYRRVVFSTVGDIMNTMGDVQYCGGTIFCNLSAVGDIMIHVEDIMSTVGVFSTVGYSNNKRFPPWY